MQLVCWELRFEQKRERKVRERGRFPLFGRFFKDEKEEKSIDMEGEQQSKKV